MAPANGVENKENTRDGRDINRTILYESGFNGLTFLHRAKAIMVIRLPGTPTNMNTMHVADAKVSKPFG